MPRKKQEPKALETEDIRGLLARAEQGEARALDLLKEKVDESFWLKVVSLSGMAETTLIRRMAGGDKHLLVREVLERRLAAMKADVAGPDPTPLERLLADRVAFTWLSLQLAENAYLSVDSMTLPQAAAAQKRIDACHRRHMTAIRTLAQVRRLQLPVVQVNVAQAGARQLNVAAPAASLTAGEPPI